MRGYDGRGTVVHRPPRPWAPMILSALVGIAVGVSVVGVAWYAAPTSARASDCTAAGGSVPHTATPLRHLFIVVKENHALENYFGDLPGVLGNPPNGSFPASFGAAPTVHPFALTGTSTPDMPHDAGSDRTDLNGGQSNLFVAVANASGDPTPQDAVGYYTAQQIPDYFAYARNFSLGDEFFTGVLGPTAPNRVFDLSAFVGSWNADSQPPANVTDKPTILDQLSAAGVGWNYDYLGASTDIAPYFFPSLTGTPCSAARLTSVSALPAQVSSTDAPSVVYLDPSNSYLYSEHPPANVTLGDRWTVAVVNTIERSPIWNSSAILLFYDENGGFWDPVVPPITSTGSDGFRVPFLVISPWTPVGRICSEPLDPATVLHFIDYNWGLPPLNERVATAPLLSSCFLNFTSPTRPPLVLPTNVSLSASGGSGSAFGPGSGPIVGSSGPPSVGGAAESAGGAREGRRTAVGSTPGRSAAG
jgi:phospholipase C